MLHVDRELLVLDKPAGLAVQGGPGVISATLRTQNGDSELLVCSSTHVSTLVATSLVLSVLACRAGVPVSVDEALKAATWLPRVESSHPRRAHLSCVV